MDFLKKRISKIPKAPAEKRKDDFAQNPISVADSNRMDDATTMRMGDLKLSESDGFIRQLEQQRIVQTNRRVVITSSTSQRIIDSSSDCHLLGVQRTFLSSDHMDSEDVLRRSPSPFRVPANRSMLVFDQKPAGFDNALMTRAAPYRSKLLEIGDEPSSTLVSRQSVDSLNLLRQCERSSTVFPKYSLQQSGSPDPLDLVIEATLRKTVETFQQMVEEQRAELVRMFPHLGNVRRTTTADQGPGTEIVTETRIQPDGSVVEVQTVRTRRLVQMHKSINIVNGVVKNTRARAVMEYQGPNGGYRLKLEEDADQEDLPNGNSETEEDDDDSASLAPSEVSETASVVALIPRNQHGFEKTFRGGSVPRLEPKPKKKTDKAWYAAQELVESERRYVEKLRLLDQIFRTRVEGDPELAKTVGGDKLAKLFSNTGTLYAFHNDHVLPQLESKLREWRRTEKICDVMRRQAPFLKIYSEYTGNYKKATKTYEDLKKSNKRFAALVEEIGKLPECDHLPLSNHLICPVQRVTRYHLLMTEYMKNLGDGHPDKEDTLHALELTKEAASHANQMMRHLDKYKNVIEVQELLGSQVQELLTPSRELIKKGRLSKISARSGEHQTRFVFLFNDMLLICSEHRNIVMTAWSGKYKLRAIFEVDGMNVLEGDNLEVENTFYVRSGNKVVEFYATDAKEKTVWMETLWSVIQEHNKRMQSFRKPEDKKTVQLSSSASSELVDATSKAESCSNCAAIFNAFKKSYVCKSCGVILCKKCCQKKIKLHGSEKEQRVCLNCYETLKTSSTPGLPSSDGGKNGSHSSSSVVPRKSTLSPTQTTATHQISRKSVLEVRPSDSCIWSGYLDLKTASRKSWDRRYFALQQDLVLYTFRTDKDVCAKTSLPVTGCRISWVDPRQDSTLGSKDANAFKLQHSQRVYYLKAASPEDMAKCVAALELASQAQFPATGA